MVQKCVCIEKLIFRDLGLARPSDFVRF